MGYRFSARDEELIDCLNMKLTNQPLPYAEVFNDIDLYKDDPAHLFETYKRSNEETVYFFTPTNRISPNGSRASRSTPSGYWKVTASAKEIKSQGSVIGTKRSFVFYYQPSQKRSKDEEKNNKSNWIMYEYISELQANSSKNPKPSMQLNERVLCSIHKKRRSARKLENQNEPHQGHGERSSSITEEEQVNGYEQENHSGASSSICFDNVIIVPPLATASETLRVGPKPALPGPFYGQTHSTSSRVQPISEPTMWNLDQYEPTSISSNVYPNSNAVMVQPLAVDSKMLFSPSLFGARNDLAAGLAWPESGLAMGTSGQPGPVSTSSRCYNNTQPLTATQFGDQDLGSRYFAHQFGDLASLLDNNMRASTVGESLVYKSCFPKNNIMDGGLGLVVQQSLEMAVAKSQGTSQNSNSQPKATSLSNLAEVLLNDEVYEEQKAISSLPQRSLDKQEDQSKSSLNDRGTPFPSDSSPGS